MFVVSRMMFPVGAIWHDDLIFHSGILEELTFAMLEHADHAIRKSLDGNRLVNRVFAQKKCLAQVVTNDGNVGAMKIFCLGEITPDIGSRVEDLFVLDKRSRVIQAGDLLVLVTR